MQVVGMEMFVRQTMKEFLEASGLDAGDPVLSIGGKTDIRYPANTLAEAEISGQALEVVCRPLYFVHQAFHVTLIFPGHTPQRKVIEGAIERFNRDRASREPGRPQQEEFHFPMPKQKPRAVRERHHPVRSASIR